MHPNMRTLTLTSYGETPEQNHRVTLAPMGIKMVAAKDGTMQGRAVKITTVLFVDGDDVNLVLNEIDLLQLESVVGGYVNDLYHD